MRTIILTIASIFSSLNIFGQVTNSNLQITRLTLANSNAGEKLIGILTSEQYELYLKLREDTKKQKNESVKNNPGYTVSEVDKELDF
jgi:hypothetical protein